MLMPVGASDKSRREEQLKVGKGKGEIIEEDSRITCVCERAKLQFTRHVGW